MVSLIVGVLSSFITGLLTFAGVVYTSKKQYSLSIIEIKEQQHIFAQEVKGEIALIKNDIKTLNSNVEKHNKVVERTYELEMSIGILEQKIKNMEDKI